VEGFQKTGPGERDLPQGSFVQRGMADPSLLADLFVEMVSYMVSITPLVHIVPFATDYRDFAHGRGELSGR